MVVFFSDKSIQFEEDSEETYSKHVEEIVKDSENRTDMKELPPSDTTESVQIIRNNKSTTSLEPEKGTYLGKSVLCIDTPRYLLLSITINLSRYLQEVVFISEYDYVN